MKRTWFILLLAVVLPSSAVPSVADNRSSFDCVDYVLDLVDGVVPSGRPRVRIDDISGIRLYLDEIASSAAVQLFDMLADRNRADSNVLGASIRGFEASYRGAALCYLRGRCVLLEGTSVFYPLVFDEHGPTMLFTPGGTMRDHRPARMPVTPPGAASPQVLFFSEPAFEHRSDVDAVVTTFGEIAMLTGWRNLVSVARAAENGATLDPRIARFLDRQAAPVAWDTGFVFTYLTLRRMLARRLATAELSDIQMLDLDPETDESVERAMAQFEREARALILGSRPTTQRAIDGLGLLTPGNTLVSLLPKIILLESLVAGAMPREP